MERGASCPPQLPQVGTLGLGLGPAAEAAAHDFGHSHEVVGVAGADRAALNLVFAVVLLGRQTIDKHHLGSHSVAALDMADVVALDAAWGGWQLQQLGQVFSGQQLLLGAALSPLQLVAGIALQQLDQISFLLPLGHGKFHLAAAALRQPLLDQGLLG